MNIQTAAAVKPRVPHPFPYQGSKRGIAAQILPHLPINTRCLIEPFCGSAAISLACAASGRVQRFWLNDANAPLIGLWAQVLERPVELAARYEELWRQQLPDRKAFFFQVRDEFNRTHEPHLLLYLLARIVKGAIRYSADGRFNQSPDNRRSGMQPSTPAGADSRRFHVAGDENQAHGLGLQIGCDGGDLGRRHLHGPALSGHFLH